MCRGLGTVLALNGHSVKGGCGPFYHHLPRVSGMWGGQQAPPPSSIRPPVQALVLPWVSHVQPHFHSTSQVHTSKALPLGEELKIKPSLQILQVNTQLPKNSTFAAGAWSQAGRRDEGWRGRLAQPGRPGPSPHLTHLAVEPLALRGD